MFVWQPENCIHINIIKAKRPSKFKFFFHTFFYSVDILCDSSCLDSTNDFMKSTPAKADGELYIKVLGPGNFYIYIKHSDKTACKNDETDIEKCICAPLYRD